MTEGASVLASRAYKAYRLWGLDEGMNDKEMLTSTTFGTKMTARFDKKKRNDGTHYIGVGLWTERPEPGGEQGALTKHAPKVTGCEAEYPSLSGSSLVESVTRENIDQPVTTRHPVTFEACVQAVWHRAELGGYEQPLRGLSRRGGAGRRRAP